MRELTEKELLLISGGQDTREFEGISDGFGWGTSGGITGPTFSGDGWSVSVGGGSGAGPNAGTGPVGGAGVSVDF